MHARAARTGHGHERGPHGVGDAPEPRPGRGHLQGVDHVAARRQRVQAGDVVAVGEPRVDESRVGGLAALGSRAARHDGEGRVHDLGGRLVVHEQRAPGAVAAVGAARLALVVETQHRRGRARAERGAHRPDARGERGQAPGRARPRRGRGPGPQPGPRHDAERALGADEQRGEVGARGARGLGAEAQQRAVGEHHLEARDEVGDRADPRRVLAGAAGADPPADGREREGLRVVADGEAVWRERILELGPHGARERLHEARLGVDGHHASQRAGGEHHAAAGGDRGAEHARAAARDGEGHPVLVAESRDGAHLVGGGGLDDRGGAARGHAAVGPREGERPPVARVRVEDRVVDVRGGGVAERGEEGGGDLPTRSRESFRPRGRHRRAPRPRTTRGTRRPAARPPRRPTRGAARRRARPTRRARRSPRGPRVARGCAD